MISMDGCMDGDSILRESALGVFDLDGMFPLLLRFLCLPVFYLISNHNHTIVGAPPKARNNMGNPRKGLPKAGTRGGEEQELGEETSRSLPAVDGDEAGDFLTLTTRWFASCLR